MSDAIVTPGQPTAPAAPVAPAAPPAAPVPSLDLGQPAPVPAPAAAPVAPAAKDDPKAPPVPTYEPTGDAGLDYSLSFVAKAGFAEDHPAMVAAFKGDFGLLKAELAQKGIPGWEQAVALGEQAYKKFSDEAAADIKAVGETVLATAAQVGVDWEDTVKWAKENGTQDELAAINDMLAKPGTAKIAAFYLTSQYANSGKVSVPPQRQAAKPDAVAESGPANSSTPITRVEFAREAGNLQRKYGDEKYMQSAEYQALYRRLIK